MFNLRSCSGAVLVAMAGIAHAGESEIAVPDWLSVAPGDFAMGAGGFEIVGPDWLVVAPDGSLPITFQILGNGEPLEGLDVVLHLTPESLCGSPIDWCGYSDVGSYHEVSDANGEVTFYPEAGGVYADPEHELWVFVTDRCWTWYPPQGYEKMISPDHDGNHQVDVGDFAWFEGAFNSGDPEADFNRDGSVDATDFVIFETVFGASCP